MGCSYAGPDRVLWVVKVFCFTYKKIIIVGKKLGQPRFPKSVYSLLTSKLTVIVFCGMQWHICICYIMTEFRGDLEYSIRISHEKGIPEPVVHGVYMPWNNTIRFQGVFGIFTGSIVPEFRHDPQAAVTIMVKVNVVPRRLVDYRIPAPVRIYRCFCYVSNVAFVKPHHGGRKGKDCQPVYPLVAKEPPTRQ